jgi:GNAT superfamily N-acetyltransferase
LTLFFVLLRFIILLQNMARVGRRIIVLDIARSPIAYIGVIAAQNESYGESAPGSDVIRGHRLLLEAGGIAIMARDIATGEAVGGGICNTPIDQATELTSVGIRIPYRRKGIAAALTAKLVQLAWTSGITTVFLMAAHEAEARIYAHVGFRAIGEVLDIRYVQGDGK